MMQGAVSIFDKKAEDSLLPPPPEMGGYMEQLIVNRRSCVELADRNNLKSIAFCCISTGEFHFPNDKAAQIAVQTVKDYKVQTHSEIEVIFNVFKETDYNIYRELLGAN